jgi:hypothetical protein
MRNTGGRGQKERGWVRYDTADTSSSVCWKAWGRLVGGNRTDFGLKDCLK